MGSILTLLCASPCTAALVPLSPGGDFGDLEHSLQLKLQLPKSGFPVLARLCRAKRRREEGEEKVGCCRRVPRYGQACCFPSLWAAQQVYSDPAVQGDTCAMELGTAAGEQHLWLVPHLPWHLLPPSRGLQPASHSVSPALGGLAGLTGPVLAPPWTLSFPRTWEESLPQEES